MTCKTCAKIRRMLPQQVQLLLAQRAERRRKPTPLKLPGPPFRFGPPESKK